MIHILLAHLVEGKIFLVQCGQSLRSRRGWICIEMAYNRALAGEDGGPYAQTHLARHLSTTLRTSSRRHS